MSRKKIDWQTIDPVIEEGKLSYSEISEKFSISLNTLKSHTHYKLKPKRDIGRRPSYDWPEIDKILAKVNRTNLTEAFPIILTANPTMHKNTLYGRWSYVRSGAHLARSVEVKRGINVCRMTRDQITATAIERKLANLSPEHRAIFMGARGPLGAARQFAGAIL